MMLVTCRWSVIALMLIVFVPCPAEAQQPGKIFRIGYLDGSTASGMTVLLDEFRQELRKLGWIEGKNISIEYRFAEQKPERLPELLPTWFDLRSICLWSQIHRQRQRRRK